MPWEVIEPEAPKYLKVSGRLLLELLQENNLPLDIIFNGHCRKIVNQEAFMIIFEKGPPIDVENLRTWTLPIYVKKG